MKQLKVFTGGHSIWDDVNEWLQEHASITIYGFMQSESFSGDVWSLTITVIYDGPLLKETKG